MNNEIISHEVWTTKYNLRTIKDIVGNINVIKDGHRAAVDEFAIRSRHPDSDWRAIEFDGIDNSHTHVPYLNYSDNKGYNSMEKIKFKTTGFVEYGNDSKIEESDWQKCLLTIYS